MGLMPEGATSHTRADTNAVVAQQTARLPVGPLPTASPDDPPLDKRCKTITPHDPPVHSFPTCAARTDTVAPARLTLAHAPTDVLALGRRPTALAKVAEERFRKQAFS
jgi:hypothetical protein